MKTPFFSVIIPTLNEEKYISKILNSLAKQTFRGFELIVVDGKSDDKTVLIYEKFKYLLPKTQLVISNKRNVGYQRNLGAIKAKGQYLIFFDADCDIDFTFMEELHIAAIKQKFPFATTWIKPDSEKTIDEFMMLLANLTQEFAKGIKRQFAGGYNTVVTREFFTKMKGFREDLVINEDCDFALRAQKQGVEVTILKEPYVVYSLRRFRKEGTLPLLRKYAQAQIYNLMAGPMTKDVIGYPMGGQAHFIKRKKEIDLTKWNTYLKGIRKLEKKMLSLLEE